VVKIDYVPVMNTKEWKKVVDNQPIEETNCDGQLEVYNLVTTEDGYEYLYSEIGEYLGCLTTA